MDLLLYSTYISMLTDASEVLHVTRQVQSDFKMCECQVSGSKLQLVNNLGAKVSVKIKPRTTVHLVTCK